MTDKPLVKCPKCDRVVLLRDGVSGKDGGGHSIHLDMTAKALEVHDGDCGSKCLLVKAQHRGKLT